MIFSLIYTFLKHHPRKFVPTVCFMGFEEYLLLSDYVPLLSFVSINLFFPLRSHFHTLHITLSSLSLSFSRLFPIFVCLQFYILILITVPCKFPFIFSKWNK